jgi:hypothetical protein
MPLKVFSAHLANAITKRQDNFCNCVWQNVQTKNLKQDEDANHYISDVVVGAKTG